MTHDVHTWEISRTDNSFRCVQWRCGARVTFTFLENVDPRIVGGLDGAYQLYLKTLTPLTVTRGEHYSPTPVTEGVPPSSQSTEGAITLPERSEGLDKSLSINALEDQSALKRCSICKERKPYNEFHRRKRSADGRQSRCRRCNVAAVNASRRKNRKSTS